MNKCVGCGINTEKETKLCERCFRIRNYNDYKLLDIDNQKFIDILKSINQTKDLVVFVIDIFNFNNLNEIRKYLKNDILVVLNKKDILPKKISDEKLIEYFKKFNLNYKDIVIISSIKNYNFDSLYEKINKHKTSKNVYIVGFTNAGKSTMINKIIYNYSNNNDLITTSILPSTTLNSIEININDNLTLIDTPGILYNKSFYDILDGKELKKITPKKEIKPISYQIKKEQTIIIDKYLKIEVSNINLVIFMSNNLNVKRTYQKINNVKKEIYVDNNDLVISGLGFIKFIGSGKIKIDINKEIDIYTRDSLI